MPSEALVLVVTATRPFLLSSEVIVGAMTHERSERFSWTGTGWHESRRARETRSFGEFVIAGNLVEICQLYDYS